MGRVDQYRERLAIAVSGSNDEIVHRAPSGARGRGAAVTPNECDARAKRSDGRDLYRDAQSITSAPLPKKRTC